MENDPDSWRGYEWTALSVTTVGALLASIQGSALLIALPDIMAQLHAGFMTIMWVILGFMLITTALVPVVGRLADMFGRKRLYNAGFAIFTLGSLLSGLSQPQFQGWDMVFYRMIQGVGGALLFTNSAAIVTDAFRKGRVGLGLGINTIAFSAGFLMGPVIGGILTAIDWRLVFLINVPLGIAGTVWGVLRLREPAPLALFTGNANPALAQDIARLLQEPVARSTVGRFSDGEINVEILENIRGRDVFLVQSTCPPANNTLMELLVMIDAFKRASAGRITAVIPYFGYARQDRKVEPRVPISSKVMANIIQATGAEVIHLGHDRSVEDVVNTAIQEEEASRALGC